VRHEIAKGEMSRSNEAQLDVAAHLPQRNHWNLEKDDCQASVAGKVM
jgi:hypothetical protein